MNQLTIVVDLSPSMGQAKRLEHVRQALLELHKRLGPRERLSLVTFGERSHVVLENVGVGDGELWTRAVQSLQSAASGNLADGLLTGLSVARAQRPPKAKLGRVVLITDQGDELDETLLTELLPALGQAKAEGLSCDVLRLTPAHEPSARWSQLARAAGGTDQSIVRPAQLMGELSSVLRGTPQTLLYNVRLSVSFSPKLVQSFRLVGYEPSSLLTRTGSDSNLFPGETIAAVFEIELHPMPMAQAAAPMAQPADGELAQARLEWSAPLDGPRRTLTQRLLRSQVATSFAESPAHWQAATVAAATAEILRGSPFAEHLSIDAVAQWTNQCLPQLRAERTFAVFVELLTGLEQLMRQSAPPRNIRSKN